MGVRRRLNPLRLMWALTSALLVLCVMHSGGSEEILGVLPVVLLALALCFERYPGEELIERLAERLRPRPEATVGHLLAPLRAAVALLRLRTVLAAARRLRAPPLLPLAHS